MSECEEIIKAGFLASRHFRKAQKLYIEMKRQLVQGGNKIFDRTDANQDQSSDNPGLFGEIETNLMVAKHILGTRDLEKRETKEAFLEMLRGERKDFDLPSLFFDVEWSWTEYHSFIRDLLKRMLECFQNVTRKLTYTTVQFLNPQDTWKMDALENFTQDFQDMFGVRLGGNWRKYAEKESVSVKTRMYFLRRFLSAGIANSFGWVMRRQGYMLIEYGD